MHPHKKPEKTCRIWGRVFFLRPGSPPTTHPGGTSDPPPLWRGRGKGVRGTHILVIKNSALGAEKRLKILQYPPSASTQPARGEERVQHPRSNQNTQYGSILFNCG